MKMGVLAVCLMDGWLEWEGEGEMNLAVVYNKCNPGGDSRKKSSEDKMFKKKKKKKRFVFRVEG